MYCIACGKRLSNSAKFCSRCGTRVPDIDQETLDKIAEMEAEPSETSAPTPGIGIPNVQIPTDQLADLGRNAYQSARAAASSAASQARAGLSDALDEAEAEHDTFNPRYKRIFGVGHLVLAASVFLPWVQYGNLRTLSAVDYVMILFSYVSQTLGQGRSLVFLIFALLTTDAVAAVVAGNLYGAYRQLMESKGSGPLFKWTLVACAAFIVLLVAFNATYGSMAQAAGQAVAQRLPSWGIFAALAVAAVMMAMGSGRIDLDHLVDKTRK